MSVSESWTAPPSRDSIIKTGSELLDPKTVTLKGLARMGPDQYVDVMRWLEGERKRLGLQQVAKEAELEARAEVLREEAAERHAAREQYLSKHPWERAT